jgi:Holliday junction resolvase RusA-like endonuclease
MNAPRGCGAVFSFDLKGSRAQGRAFREDAVRLIRSSVAKPVTGRLAVAITLCEPDRRRRDIDNYVKLLFDAANGLLWRDDAQVVDLHANKRYGAVPGIRLRLSEAE